MRSSIAVRLLIACVLRTSDVKTGLRLAPVKLMAAAHRTGDVPQRRGDFGGRVYLQRGRDRPTSTAESRRGWLRLQNDDGMVFLLIEWLLVLQLMIGLLGMQPYKENGCVPPHQWVSISEICIDERTPQLKIPTLSRDQPIRCCAHRDCNV